MNPEKFNKKLGARIRELRKIAGQSQEQLGKALNVSYQQIQKYERGMNELKMRHVVQIAHTLCISLNDVFDGLNQMEPRLKREIPTARRMLALFENLTPKQQKTMLHLAECMLGVENG